MALTIESWAWDLSRGRNVDHLARRGITPELVEDVWLESPKYLPNRKGRSASHLMVGPDNGGKIWTFCIVQVSEEPATWKAITGWPSKEQEIQWYSRAR